MRWRERQRGGVGPFVFDLASGSLPDGLALDGKTGAITGQPTTAGTAANIVCRATDSEEVEDTLPPFSIDVAAAALPAPTFTTQRTTSAGLID